MNETEMNTDMQKKQKLMEVIIYTDKIGIIIDDNFMQRYNKPKPPWFSSAYTILCLKTSGSLWNLVGRVSSRAQVDAVGNSAVELNLRAAASNP